MREGRKIFAVKVYREDDYGLYHVEAKDDVEARKIAVGLDDVIRAKQYVIELDGGEAKPTPIPPVEYCETDLHVTLDN